MRIFDLIKFPILLTLAVISGICAGFNLKEVNFVISFVGGLSLVASALLLGVYLGEKLKKGPPDFDPNITLKVDPMFFRMIHHINSPEGSHTLNRIVDEIVKNNESVKLSSHLPKDQ